MVRKKSDPQKVILDDPILAANWSFVDPTLV